MTKAIKQIWEKVQGLPEIVGRAGAGSAWRTYAIAAVLGVIASFAMPAYNILAALVFAVVLMLWLLWGAKTKREAAGIAFFFGFAFFTVGLAWVANSILLFAQNLVFVLPILYVGIGIWGGVFLILNALPCYMLRGKLWAAVLVFGALWGVLEWVRSWLFTGFPFNLSLVWDKSLEIMQVLALVGAYGLSLLTMLLIGILAIVPMAKTGRQALWRLGVLAALVAAIYGFGVVRLGLAEESKNMRVPEVFMRVVQPNIVQTLAWDEEKKKADFIEQLKVSQTPQVAENAGAAGKAGAVGKAGAASLSHIIWSETASPYPLESGEGALELITSTLPSPADTVFISGVIRREGKTPFNAAIVAQGGEVLGHYNKSHLVPFGEYVPLRGILPLEKFTPGGSDFGKGAGATSLSLPKGGKVGIAICYEVAFAGRVVDRENPPDWLLNVTYDGWFGKGSGPRQHFATSFMRAIEEGLPLVRAAGTGASALISPYGEILAYLDLDEKGVLDFGLPVKIKGGTFYGHYGNAVPLVLALFLLVLAAGVAACGQKKLVIGFANKDALQKRGKK